MRPKAITKTEIISIAEKVIKEEGIKKCSMRRLSKELSVAIGTIYNYYESRDELLLEVFEISWKRTLDDLEKYINPLDTPLDQIKDLISLIQRDVDHRNGLGQEIIIYRLKEKENDDHLDIRGSLASIINSILEKAINNHYKCQMISRWIVLIIIDKIKNKQRWNELEWSLIKGIVDNNATDLPC